MTARKPLQIFLAVQKALFLRELGMRFSAGKAGLFWTFFEPFMQVLVMVLIKMLLFGRASDTFDFAVFLALNFTAYNLFKNIVDKSLATFKANKGLFIYKQVKPINTIFARALVEIYITSIIILIFVGIGLYFNFDLNVKNLPLVFLGFVILIIFAISIGILMSVLNHFYNSIGKVFNILMRLLLFISALFYTVEMLPPVFQKIVLINPLTHIMEVIHGYYFYTLDDKYVSYNYIFIWILSVLFIGLKIYKALERKIISS